MKESEYIDAGNLARLRVMDFLCVQMYNTKICPIKDINAIHQKVRKLMDRHFDHFDGQIEGDK